MATLSKQGTEIGRWTQTYNFTDHDVTYDAVSTKVLTDRGVILTKTVFKNHSDGSPSHTTGWKIHKTGCITDVAKVGKALADIYGYVPA